MEAILRGIKRQKIPINPAIVISNNPDASGLKIAQKLGVKTEVIPSKDFAGTRLEYDQKIIAVLQKHGVSEKNGLVCLAGFMRIISPEFIQKYKNRILNIHPAILPAFPGLHAQKQAVEYGAKYSGCTVHFVDSGVDTGPIILQSVVKVKDNDTEETLAKRILVLEHRLYPQAVKLFAQGKITISGRKTIIKNQDH
jgi:phosphoribosylglycinamide formyltransferase-1